MLNRLSSFRGLTRTKTRAIEQSAIPLAVRPSRRPKGRSAGSDPDPLLLAAVHLCRPRLVHLSPAAHFRHADIPPCIARRPGKGIGDEGDDRGPVGGLG